jgi:hypothetical protein
LMDKAALVQRAEKLGFEFWHGLCLCAVAPPRGAANSCC